jgi:hypothetical protein
MGKPVSRSRRTTVPGGGLAAAAAAAMLLGWEQVAASRCESTSYKLHTPCDAAGELPARERAFKQVRAQYPQW